MLSIRRFCVAFLLMAGLTVSAATSRAVDPRLLPANTEIVFQANIKQMLKSELAMSKQEGIKQLKAAMDQPPLDEVAKYLKQMGFDPFSDLISVTIAHPGSMDPREIFMVVDGSFQPAKFEAAFAKLPVVTGSSKFKNTTIFEIQTPPNNDKAYVALIGAKSLVMSTQESELKGAINRAGGTTVAATKVQGLLKTTNDKQSLSITITGEAMTRLAQNAPNLPANVGQAMAAIEGITGAITITKEINFQLGVGTKNDMTAKDLVSLGQGLLFFANGLAAQKAQQEEDFKVVVEVLRTLRLSSVGSNALLTGSVSQENLEKLVKTLGNQFKGFGN